MDLRTEIRRIISEDLASLANPLDKAADAVSISTQGFQARVDSLKKRAKQEKDNLVTNLNAKRKAKMVPQGNDPEIERQRRQLMDKEIADLDMQRKHKDEEAEEIDAMTTDLGGLTNSLSSLEKERNDLQALLASMGVNQPESANQ